MIDCSVIIPVYNAEKTIKETLNCFVNIKGDLTFEIIVVDDGSTDGSINVVESLEGLPSLKIIKCENNGVSAARNVGMENASGEYLFFADADDLVDAERLSTCISLAKDNNCEILVADYFVNDIFSKRVSKVNCGIKYNEILSNKSVKDEILIRFVNGATFGIANLWNKVYRREFIVRNGIKFDEKRAHGEDWAFNINAFEMANNVFATDIVFYTYNIDGSQNYNKYKRNLGYSLSNGYEKTCQLNKKYGFFKNDSYEMISIAVDFLGKIKTFIKMDGVLKQEKKIFIKSDAVKNALKTIIEIKKNELQRYQLSRKDVVFARLILMGFLRLAAKIN